MLFNRKGLVALAAFAAFAAALDRALDSDR